MKKDESVDNKFIPSPDERECVIEYENSVEERVCMLEALVVELRKELRAHKEDLEAHEL